jgi:cellulose synthase/poly-beta-1,6-N-acetylglucosamine synthase-like glycosyltransferase
LDNILTWCALISAIALLVGAYAFISQRANLDSAWQVFLPLYAVSMLFLLMFAPLWLIWWVNRRLPSPGSDRPPVDIIIPAYNESENIARLLTSIDVAAGRYGGLVRVVVSNDGSTDDTAELAAVGIAAFRHARGEVLSAANGGQAVALNRGIAITDAEIIIRVDADCVLGEDALVYSVPWFRDPEIGMVGGMEEPRTDTVSWFHRMRALETAFQFRFARLGQSMVDGVVVIPGTFTVFRRGPAETAGGFPTGMNGEDTDLTMQTGRLGYRVAVDPRIRSYEDVPRSPGEFVEQRTRWARAGFHVFARHVPLRSGSAGPRVWFWTVRRGFAWFSLQAGLVAPIFLLELALTNPTYRQNVATFALLYIIGGGVTLVVSVPYAVKYRYWRSILWAPTWFLFSFLRRLATLEAAISLPVRPFPATVPMRPAARRRPPVPVGALGPSGVSVDAERLSHRLGDVPDDFQYPPEIRAQRALVRMSQRGGAGQCRARCGEQRGLQQRPGQLVEPAPHRGPVLGPRTGLVQGRQQLGGPGSGGHLQAEGIDPGAGRRDGRSRLEGIQQRAHITCGRRVVQPRERNFLVPRVVSTEVDRRGGAGVRQHPERQVQQADRPAEIGDGVHRELPWLAAETGHEQQLRRLQGRLRVKGDVRAVQADHPALGPAQQPLVDERVVDDVSEPRRRAEHLTARGRA